MNQVASPNKILFHKEKVQEYLGGNFIFPATLELDITDACSRKCKDCPSARSSFNRQLEIDFIDRLFGRLEGQTKGLLLTGGEPTMSPLFPRVLSMARQRGFEDIAVVTNGSFLHKNSVVDALLANASTIRLSLYDRGPETCADLALTFQHIRDLRQRIDREKSAVKIGVSLLTTQKNGATLASEAEAVRQSGAHWIYFHPACTGWREGAPRQEDQEGVLETVNQYRSLLKDGFDAHIFPERYLRSLIRFDSYHAAHFLMVVGADGLNYLGPEVKYQPRHVVADLNEDMDKGFLWHPGRITRIASVKSDTYPAIGSRHRGALYSHLLEKMIREKNPSNFGNSSHGVNGFMFPHIL